MSALMYLDLESRRAVIQIVISENTDKQPLDAGHKEEEQVIPFMPCWVA